ncbi:MAG: DNA replication complex GINS family protein, partial [ANME-2 cluster archaeon]|nr:DNA replication complex GINS family protein [ANME-2 cluster archaeon]
MKYEDLTHIMEEEKKTALSKLLPGFYSKVNEYIKELETADRNIYKRHSEEAVLIQYEMKNALATIDKIFQKRTRKIIKIASARAFSKTPENTIHDIEHMTPQEQEVYHQMRNAIMKYKEASINPILGNDDGKGSDIASKARDDAMNSPSEAMDVPQARNASAHPPADDTGIPLDSEEILPAVPYENADIPRPGDGDTPAVPAEDVRLSEGNVDSGIKSENIGHNEVPEPPAADEIPPDQIEKTNENSGPKNQESAGTGKNDINKEYIVVRLLKDIPEFMGA